MKKTYISIFLKYSPIIALSINFVGAVFLVYYAGAYTGEGTVWASVDANGHKLETIYLLNPTMFKTGIWFIIVGFFIQLINECLLKFDLIKNLPK